MVLLGMSLKPFGICTSGWLQIRRRLLSWFQSLPLLNDARAAFYGKLPEYKRRLRVLRKILASITRVDVRNLAADLAYFITKKEHLK
jgi:hypothetical protein